MNVLSRRSLNAIRIYVKNKTDEEKNKLLAMAGIDLESGTVRAELVSTLRAQSTVLLDDKNALLLIAADDLEFMNSVRRPVPLACWAAQQGDEAAIQAALAAGAEFDIMDMRGFFPIHLAAKNSNELVLSALMDARADLEAKGRGANGSTACHFAATNISALPMEMLIAAGVNVNAAGSYQRSPLHFAVGSEHACKARIVKALIAAGADANAKGLWGRTPLHLTQNGIETVPLLVAAGADIEARDSEGSTPLHRVRDQQTAIALIRAGASVDATDQDGKTPVWRVAPGFGMPNADTVMLTLFAAGADATARPLGAVVGSLVPEWAALLFAAGYKPDKADLADIAKRANKDEWMALINDADRINDARKKIIKHAVELVRPQAFEICVGLQPLSISALEAVRILRLACSPFSAHVPFHIWWNIVTTVKHFSDQQVRRD
jgi:hypothetical protein